jgi:hypothetical protein
MKIAIRSGARRPAIAPGRCAAALALCGLALCGCAQHYVIRENNGMEIDAYGKPKLEGGSFHYKDGAGNEVVVPSGRVSEVAPASVSKEEKRAFTPPKPKAPKHWYFLWLF